MSDKWNIFPDDLPKQNQFCLCLTNWRGLKSLKPLVFQADYPNGFFEDEDEVVHNVVKWIPIPKVE